MPRIAAATVAENREFRRESLLHAAAALMQRGSPFTVTEVAREVGLSRTAVYEYYSSAAELIADVVVDELTAWSTALAEDASEGAAPAARIRDWIQRAVGYAADGRHALLRAAGSIELPPDRRAEVRTLHEALVAPVVSALRAAGSPDPERRAGYVWGAVEVGISRVEAGEASAVDETRALIQFVDAALGTTEGA